MRRFDLIIFVTVIIIALIGIIVIYGATYPSSSLALHKKQALFFAFGLIAMVAGILIPLKVHYLFAYYYYGLTCLLLSALLFQPGEVDRWIDLGIINFQPSELAKLVLIITMSRFLLDQKKHINSFKIILISFLMTLVPFLLVIKQPDLGTGLVFFVILIVMLFLSGVKPLYIFVGVSTILSLIFAFHWIAWAAYFVLLITIMVLSRPPLKLTAVTILGNLLIGILTPFLWNRLHEYQQERILGFLDPGRDPFGTGYQLIQSKIALGSGGITGKGFLNGTQTKLAFLPAKATDFIFATLGEQFGLIGEIVILGLFLLLLYRIVKIAIESRNTFGKLVCTGIAAVIFVQIFVNIGVTAGIMPVTGLPLPLISYGGTSLVVTMFMIGLVLNVGLHRWEY